MIHTSPYNIKATDAKRHLSYIKKVWTTSSINEVEALKKDMALTYNEVYRQPHLTHEKLTSNEKALQETYLKSKGITQCPTKYNYEVSVRAKLNERHDEDDIAFNLITTPRYNLNNDEVIVEWGAFGWYDAMKQKDIELWHEIGPKVYPHINERIKKYKSLIKRKARIVANKGYKNKQPSRTRRPKPIPPSQQKPKQRVIDMKSKHTTQPNVPPVFLGNSFKYETHDKPYYKLMRAYNSNPKTFWRIAKAYPLNLIQVVVRANHLYLTKHEIKNKIAHS